MSLKTLKNSFLLVFVCSLFIQCALFQERQQQVFQAEQPKILYQDYASYNLTIDVHRIPDLMKTENMMMLQSKGFNTVTLKLFDDYQPQIQLDAWDTFFPGTVKPRYSKNELKQFITWMKQFNMKVWVTLPTLTVPAKLEKRNPELFAQLKLWGMKNRDGNSVFKTEDDFFLCPNNPMLRELTQNVFAELMENYELDGCIFTGLRYPFLSQYIRSSYCNCKYCKKYAMEAYSIDLPSLTDEFERNPDYGYFLNAHLDSLRDYLRYMTDTIELTPAFVLSTEIYSDFPDRKYSVFQDIDQLFNTIPNIQLIFRYQSPMNLFDHILRDAKTIEPRQSWGIVLDPSFTDHPKLEFNDMMKFTYNQFSATTFQLDATGANYPIFQSVLPLLDNRQTFYMFGNSEFCFDHIIRVELFAPYLTMTSKKRLDGVYQQWSAYHKAKDNEDKYHYLKLIHNSLLQTMPLVNVQKTPARKKLLLAYKCFINYIREEAYYQAIYGKTKNREEIDNPELK